MKDSWFIEPYKLKKINFRGKTNIRYPKDFVKKILIEFTRKGDIVFDPFAGFGTTLFVAQELKRIGIGIEYDQKHYDYIKKQLKNPSKIIHGNSLKINSYRLPKFDFCMTSPPYMRYFDREDPFTNYTKPGNYLKYLKDIRKIFLKIKQKMKENATLIIEVSNTFDKHHPMTPLAWDIARELSKIFFFEREIIYGVKNSAGNTHSYLLLFINK